MGEEFLKTADDLNGIYEVAKHIKSGDKASGGMLGDLLGPIGGLFDIAACGEGGYNLAKGIDQGDDLSVVDGVHDIIDGTSGLLGNVPGPVGAIAKAGNAGFTIGDAIAPYYFNDAASQGQVVQEVPEGGFHARTGNADIDMMIDGAHQLSDGDYLGGAGSVAEGALETASDFIPLLKTLDVPVDALQWMLED